MIFSTYIFFWTWKNFRIHANFIGIFQKMNLLPQFFLEMVVIGLLGGFGGRAAGVVGHGRAWSGRAWRWSARALKGCG